MIPRSWTLLQKEMIDQPDHNGLIVRRRLVVVAIPDLRQEKSGVEGFVYHVLDQRLDGKCSAAVLTQVDDQPLRAGGCDRVIGRLDLFDRVRAHHRPDRQHGRTILDLHGSGLEAHPIAIEECEHLLGRLL